MATLRKKKSPPQSPLRKNLLPLAVIALLVVAAIASSLFLSGNRTTGAKASENTPCKKDLKTCLLNCMKASPTDFTKQEACAAECKSTWEACRENAPQTFAPRVKMADLPCPTQCEFKQKSCFATCEMCEGMNNVCGCRGKGDRRKCEQACRKEKKDCLSVCPLVSPTMTPPSATPQP